MKSRQKRKSPSSGANSDLPKNIRRQLARAAAADVEKERRWKKRDDWLLWEECEENYLTDMYILCGD